MSQQVGILDWHQETNERPRTFLRLADARNLVQRLAAEEIRNGLIRMFAPDSVFYALRPVSPQVHFMPTKLPPAEVENCKFVPPASDKRPTVAGIRLGWDWSHEAPPADMRASA